MLLPPELESGADLRQRVVEAVRAHRREPRPAAAMPELAPGRVPEVARAALDALLTRPFRVGPLPPREVYDQLLARVLRRVRRGQPIRISMGFGAQKNPNGVADSRADWAEFFALCHLIAWHNKVQAVYPPGLSIRIVMDDATLLWANHGDARLMESYRSSLTALIHALNYDQVIRPPVRLLWLSWVCGALYPLAWWRVARWEREPAHREQLERMDAAAHRNLALPPGLDPAEQAREAQRAAHRYRLYWEALRLSGLSRGRRRIIALYLDGSQHHVRQPVTLHVTTLDKGQVTQPWQGEGALRDNGHGRLEPYVLTAARRQQCSVRTVDGLDLLHLPGFDRIAVAGLGPAATREPVDGDRAGATRSEPGTTARLAEQPH
jgi:hypothetical protein